VTARTVETQKTQEQFSVGDVVIRCFLHKVIRSFSLHAQRKRY